MSSPRRPNLAETPDRGDWGSLERPTSFSRSVDVSELAALPARPLRLCVSRGALGIELTVPVRVGPVVVSRLEWGLPGLDYPVDLSAGVKAFLCRPGVIGALELSLDLSSIARRIAMQSELFVGEQPECRLLMSKTPEVRVCVELWSATRALVFDLVLSSSLRAQFSVDLPRGVGLPVPALQIALNVLDGAWNEPGEELQSIRRRGRSFELASGLERLGLELFPSLGARIPSFGMPTLTNVVVESNGLRLAFEEGTEPLSLGPRGVRLRGLAQATRAADDALVGGNWAETRSALLEVIESSPGCVEALQGLAELDRMIGGREEAARSFLLEARGRAERARSTAPEISIWLDTLEGQMLIERAGSADEGRALLARAAALDPSPVFAAFLHLQCASGGERLVHLDQALVRAPGLTIARWQRIEERLAVLASRAPTTRERAEILADIEQLDALVQSAGERAQVARRAGALLLAFGLELDATQFLRKAAGLEPRSAVNLALLGRALFQQRELARAIDLFRAALELQPSAALGPEEVLAEFVDEVQPQRPSRDEVQIQLARALFEFTADTVEPCQIVARVPSRSPSGLLARRLECEWSKLSGERRLRVRATERVLEAASLGWLRSQGEAELKAFLFELAEEEAALGATELAERLRAAVCGAP